MNNDNTHAQDAWLAHLSGETEPPTAFRVHADGSELVADMRNLAGVLIVSNQVRIVAEKGGGRFDLLKVSDAMTWFAPMQLVVGTEAKPRLVPGLKVYLEDPDRLEFRGITSDPRVPFRTPPLYTTWRGFSRKARRGSWALMRKHLHEVICGGNDEQLLWLLCWMAQMIQAPAEKPGTAVVLRGVKGSGKSLVSKWLREIVGEIHSRKVSQGSHITGKFNEHLRDCLLLCVEEGVWGGDKAAEGVLKDLITADTIMIEPKGVGVVEFPNFTRLIVTSNEAWVVPATGDERRFFVLDVPKPFEGDPEEESKDRVYFEALHAEANAGGLEAMLADLEEMDFTQVNLRKPPLTEGLRAQMAQAFTPDQEWLLSALLTGEFARRDGERSGDQWELDEPLKITSAELLASFKDHVRTYNGAPAGARRLNALLKAHGDCQAHRFTVSHNERPWGYILAPRREWRERFERDHKFRFEDEPGCEPPVVVSLASHRRAA